MPLCSAFAPCGLMALSIKPSLAEDVYRAIVSAQSAAFDMTQGTPAEAEAYASAMALGRARAALIAGKNQRDPHRTYEMLPALERDYRIVPSETASVAARQDAVSARKTLSRGPCAESIQDGLTGILGASFITYRVISNTEKVVTPADPTTGPGVFGRDALPAKVFRLTSDVSMMTYEVSFTYSRIGADDGVRLAAGDTVCFEPEINMQAEKATILSATGLTATAIFTKAHGTGAALVAGPIPIWRSTKRHVLVVVESAAAVDAETRRKVDDYMARISRAPTTWDIVLPSSGTTLGPFTLDVSRLGTVTLGIVTIP